MTDISARLPDSDFVDPMANPSKANAEIAAALGAAKRDDAPVISEPEGDLVELPGGLVKGGELIRAVTVQELTGEHEELLAKAAKSNNWAHFLNVLVECGTAKIDGISKAKTPDTLKSMLLGDRDAILLGTRRATYGDDVELRRWTCPNCGEQSDLTIELSDIENVKLADPRSDTVFKVNLRKGGTATVRLVTGRDQLAAWEKPDLTAAERDSIILSRCVTAITEPDGMELVTAGLGASIALKLSIPDRKAITRELVKRQPGPRYNDVRFTHQPCGEEVPLSLGLGDLFPDI